MRRADLETGAASGARENVMSQSTTLSLENDVAELVLCQPERR